MNKNVKGKEKHLCSISGIMRPERAEMFFAFKINSNEEDLDFMKKQRILPVMMVGTMILAGSLMLSGCGQTTMPDTMKIQNVGGNVIRVSSKEQVKVVPDIAEVVYSVYSQASDAQTCQTQNNTDLGKVIELLKSQGVEEKNIQTSNYGLSPVYDWEAGKTITGYEMTTEVTVSEIPMEQVGTLLSESVDAGINTISSVIYKASKYDESYQQALEKAIASAQVKAASMAEAGGCKLGKIVNIEEYGDNQVARAGGYMTGSKEMNESSVADMAVMPGEIEVEANINIEFAIE